ncbi:MAG TPA: CHRD domain-containing protein [Steroidobacteraceae bacterium]|nr:CHRD domain-containing protein [Steroidobacteraceae bacterium]
MAASDGLHRTLVVCMLLTLQACGGGGGGYGGNSPPAQPATSPPTIALAALPSSTVNRTVTLTSDVSAAAGITRVEYLVDGTVIGTSTATPYSFAWDTSTIADGAHAVTARVTDAANVVVTSPPRNVTVANSPRITITLSPTETYPLPTSTANGTGELTFNLVNGAVAGGVTTSGITATLAHIHRGYAGTAGPVIVNFVKSASDPNRWEPQAGSLLTADQINDLLAGRLYVNVHSAAYAQGEIRGQIQPDNIDVVVSQMNGASVSPPVTSPATGVAATTVDALAGSATIHVNSLGVDDATDAHVHKAAAGANNAASLIALTKDAAAPGHWVAEMQTITPTDRTDFLANGWYVDVHTPANTAGAIRGQILPTAAAPPPPSQPAAPTLTQLQTSIFSPICSACHNGQGANLPGVMDLTNAPASFAALVNVASRQQPTVMRVAPNSPDASYLVRKIEGAAGIAGSRMPLGGPFLDQPTITQVRAWISAGAQNN